VGRQERMAGDSLRDVESIRMVVDLCKLGPFVSHQNEDFWREGLV
jgi:hypothetical protein